MNVLIACEESQIVCKSFRDKGHNAFSCDLLPCSGGFPEWHIQGDVVPLLNGSCSFVTMDNVEHSVATSWDLIIAFPPCTYFSAAGACRLFKNGVIVPERYKKAMEMKELFLSILNCSCEHICIENPKFMSVVGLPEPSQVIQPYYFGEPFSKFTYLWLKGLPCLFGTLLVDDYVSYVSTVRSSIQRSKTFPGVALAMANQWG